MRPTYAVHIWQEDGLWIAKVVSAGAGTDTAPVGSVTDAETPAEIEPMARDLIATLLDADEAEFDVIFSYPYTEPHADPSPEVVVSQTKVNIDLNIRVRGQLTYTGFEHIQGDLPSVGDSVLAVEPEDGIQAPAIVVDLDEKRHLIYLAVAWREFTERPVISGR